jgi:hypothetical protein
VAVPEWEVDAHSWTELGQPAKAMVTGICLGFSLLGFTILRVGPIWRKRNKSKAFAGTPDFEGLQAMG